MKQANLVIELAADLNDSLPGYENTIWSQAQLGAYIVEALGLIYDKRPESFMETKLIKVDSCSIIQEFDCCDKIHRVVGQATSSGRLIRTLRERDFETNLQWTGKFCRPIKKEFQLTGYSIDKLMEKVYLYPEVPVGQEVYILVDCSSKPDKDTDISVDNLAIVKQWVMYRAKMIDADIDPSAKEAASTHYQVWRDLMGLENKTTVIHRRSTDG